jgi:hypothetical protein
MRRAICGGSFSRELINECRDSDGVLDVRLVTDAWEDNEFAVLNLLRGAVRVLNRYHRIDSPPNDEDPVIDCLQFSECGDSLATDINHSTKCCQERVASLRIAESAKSVQ